MSRNLDTKKKNEDDMSNVASSSTSYILRATPSIKKYHVARFEDAKHPCFGKYSQPVMMYRDEPKEESEEENDDDAPPVSYNPAFKRRRRRVKKSLTPGWVIEDATAKNKFMGTLEGGQASSYVIFIKNEHNSEFSVIPIEQWFRFKRPPNYRTLTLEEAEELNNEKKRSVNRWLMKHKLIKDDDLAEVDVAPAPRIRTGALSSKKATSENNDMFTASETTKVVSRAVKSKPEGDPTGDDGGDFEEKFDDDESGPETTNNANTGLPSDSDSDEYGEEEGALNKLSETGQAMKDLLRTYQGGVDTGTKGSDEDDSEDDFCAKDMDKYIIKRDLGGNIIRVKKEETEVTTADDKHVGVSTVVDEEVGVKRKHEDDETKESGPSTKAPWTAPSDSSARSQANKLTEAAVQEELIKHGGRMKTKDLLKRLKRLLNTQDDKALFRDIIRTICTMETDPIDGRILVLKSQFM